MINVKTALVLGAGASNDFGFPLGNELKEKVLNSLNGQFQRDLENRYGIRPGMPDLIEAFRKDLGKDKALTIDRFLAKHAQEYKNLGKVAITKVILDCEQEHMLFAGDNWYSTLYKIIHPYPNLKNIQDNKIGIITFNYDRSLENFLYERLLGDYGSNRQSDVEYLLNNLQIIHVHGRVNTLPWEDSQLNKVTYGNRGFVPDIYEIAKGLIIPGENKANIKDAQDLISNVDAIYFLGFGYDLTNLQSLGIESIKKCKNIFGTSHNLPVASKSIINEMLGGKVEFHDKKVSDFMMNEFNPNKFLSAK